MKNRRLFLLGAALLSSVATLPLWSPSSSSQAPADDAKGDAPPVSASPPDLTVPEPRFAPARAETTDGIPAPLPQPDFAAIGAFDSWLEEWSAAMPDARDEGMVREGAKLAAARRTAFKALIAADPRQALQRAVPRVTRGNLPEEITGQLETPVSAKGEFVVKITCGCPTDGTAGEGHQPGHRSLTERFFMVDGITYNARVVAELESLRSRETAPLQGVAIDNEMAVAANAVRVLEPGEPIPAGTGIGTIYEKGGSSAPSESGGRIVEIAGNFYAVESAEELSRLTREFEEWALFEYNGSNSAGFFQSNYPNPSGKRLGSYELLFIRVAYSDSLSTSHTEESTLAQMRELERIYGNWSYGKFVVTSTLAPLVTVPSSFVNDDGGRNAGPISDHAQAEVRKLGYDPSRYDTVVILGDGIGGVAWGNTAAYAGGLDTLLHEVGHRIGAWHAGVWIAQDGTGYGFPGSNPEPDVTGEWDWRYGNGFDVMGHYATQGEAARFNVGDLIRLGWLAPGEFHQAEQSGTYRIHSFGGDRVEHGKQYAFVARKNAVKNYYLEFRSWMGGALDESALLLVGGPSENRLVDTTPETRWNINGDAGKRNLGIALGQTFSDLEADMHLTVVGRNATSPPSLDVVYQKGPFPGNVAPQLDAVVASAAQVPVGGSITFDASAAIDANGDPLSYHWEFDDGVRVGNSAVVTRSFGSGAQVTAMVTVSDMKGGRVRRHVVVTAGNPGRQVLAGNVTVDGQPLEHVRISASNGKFAYTDRSGNYALANLPTGNTTLTATCNGHALDPSIANPVNVVAGANVVNWLAVPNRAFVSLEKIADATEGGANGTFRFTRTGDVAAPLVVRVSNPGSLAGAGDFAMAPPAVAVNGAPSNESFLTFTIPAGQATLDVAVTATNDTLAEGPEGIEWHLNHNGNYLLDRASAVRMTIVDNDTALPQVAIVASDKNAAEAPGDPGSLTFTRTGSTAAALDLDVVWGGTAGNGADFPLLPAVVTIPAGQSAVTVPVQPTHDLSSEGAETVSGTLSASAAYLIRSGSGTATLDIADADVPVVTVSVAEGTATEAGGKAGVFMIHRSGAVSAPLTIYYGLRGSALHGRDYQPMAGVVVIPAGARSAPVRLIPIDDFDTEGREQVELRLASSTASYTVGAPGNGRISITDDEVLPVINVRTGSAGTEGQANASVVFRAVGGSPGNVTVRYSVGGTATQGGDYTALAGEIVVPAGGVNEVTLVIPVMEDLLEETTERVSITLTPDNAYTIEHGASAETLIRDNDSGPVRVGVGPEAGGRFPSENDPNNNRGRMRFMRTGPTTAALTVNYETGGSATNGIDYELLPGTVTIPAGQQFADVTFTPVDDNLGEGMETVTFTVAGGAGYSPEPWGMGTLEITDNDALAPTIGFASLKTLTSEAPGAGGGIHELEVRLSAAAAQAQAVSVEVAGGGSSSATGDNVDWALLDGVAVVPSVLLDFPPGTTSRIVRFRVSDDGIREGVETLSLALRKPVQASLSGTHAVHDVLVFDGAVPAPADLVTEERWIGTAVYTNDSWNASAPASSELHAGFTPRQNVGENYSRRMTGVITAPATGNYTFWIASDDASKLFVGTSASPASKVQRASLSGWTGFQNWTSNASQRSQPVAMVAGQAYYVEVQHQESGGGDHVSVAWEGPGFTRRELVVSPDDGSLPVLRFASDQSMRKEGDGGEPGLVAYLDRPAGPAGVTVAVGATGSATAGDDYSLGANSLTFGPGETTRNVPLAVISDGSAESPEWLQVSLSQPVGAQLGSPSSHLMTITDAGAPVVETFFGTANSAMAAGSDLGGLAATPAPGVGIAGWTILSGNSGNALSITAAGRLLLANPFSLPNPGGMRLIVRVTDTAGASADATVNLVCNGPGNGVLEQRWNGTLPFDLDEWSGPPAHTGNLPAFTSGQGVGDNYSRRLTGYLRPAVSGDYTFWIAGDDDSRLYLSDGPSPRNKQQIAWLPGWTGFQNWDSDQASTHPKQKSASIPLVAGKVYWMEVHHREATGGDHVSVAWQRAGAVREAIPQAAIFPTLEGLEFDTPLVPPAVILSTPASALTMTGPQDLTLAAEVVEGTLPTTSVSFYQGGTLIGTDGAAPYSVTWNGVQPGEYELTARASFAGGGVDSRSVPLSVVSGDPAADPDGDGFTTGLELTLGTNPYSAASQPASHHAGMIGWWKLDEGAGTTADDSTGRAQDGTLAGGTWIQRDAGHALQFDGVDDSLGMPAGLLGNRPAFTMTGWYRTSKSNGNRVGLWGQNDVVEFGIQGSSLSLWSPGGGGVSTPLPARNQWHHVACVGDGTNLKIYVNGVLAATGGTATGNYGSSASPFRIGGGGIWDASGNHFNGRIDDVRLYDRALGAAEIKAVRNAPLLLESSLSLFASEGLPAQGLLAVENASSTGSLTYSKASGPAWLEVAANGALSGTPGSSDIGRRTAVVRVQNTSGHSAEGTLDIEVNGAPFFTVAEMRKPSATPAAVYAASLAGDASDPEGNPLAFSKLSGPAWLVVEPNGTLGGQPLLSDVGDQLFVVRVMDPHGASSTGLVMIQVGSSLDFPADGYGNLAGTNVNDEYIQRVRIADLDHESGSNGGYSDFRGMVARLDPGQTVSYTLTPGWTGILYEEAWSVWIDLNRDGDFGDAGEKVLQLGGTSTERTGTFLMPATAGLGGTRMRVAMKYSSAPANPTGSFTYGEVEDYSVQVGPPQPPNAAPYFLADPIALTPADTLAGRAADWENHPLVFAKVAGPEWLQVSPAGGLSGTPPDDGSGAGEFVVSVTDSLGDEDTAVLRLVVEPRGFSGWAGDKGLEGPAAGFDADPDGDGLANGLEFVLGGEPNPAHPEANSTALLPVATNEDGDLVFTFPRKKAAVGTVLLHFETSADLDFAEAEDDIPVLAGDSAADGVEVDVTAGSPDAETDLVRIVVPADRAVDGRLLGRLKVTPLP